MYEHASRGEQPPPFDAHPRVSLAARVLLVGSLLLLVPAVGLVVTVVVTAAVLIFSLVPMVVGFDVSRLGFYKAADAALHYVLSLPGWLHAVLWLGGGALLGASRVLRGWHERNR